MEPTEPPPAAPQGSVGPVHARLSLAHPLNDPLGFVMRSWVSVVVLCLLLAVPAHAQESNSGDCTVSAMRLDSGASAPERARAPDNTARSEQVAVTHPRPAAAVSPSTDAERSVQNIITNDGLHVVHFWAPWCSNSRNELANGWAGLVEANPEVSFTFVTVWNDGNAGTSMLDDYNLPDRVTEVTQPGLDPSNNEATRRRSFLTHPVTWIPSTWIFHNNGELAFAMNYGEMNMSTLQSLINTTRKDW